MAISGIWNQAAANTNSLAHAQATSGSSNSSNTSDASGTNTAGITANDFLTLLVTEMKNQDPTAQTDPNQYINQLVQVNSLQQLISINQTLTGAFDTTTPTSGTGATKGETTTGIMAQNTGAPHATAQAVTSNGAAGTISNIASALQGTPAAGGAVQTTHGNLGTPATSAAAQRIAMALSGR